MKTSFRRLSGSSKAIRKGLEQKKKHPDLKNLDTAGDIWPVNCDLPIKPPRPKKSGVKDIGPVGSSKHNDTAVAGKAIHLGEKLVDGLLPLIVSTTKAGTTLSADGINLINEDDARGLGLGLLEEIPDPGGTDTDEELDELGGGAGEEWDPGLAGDGTREESFTGARRADEEASLGDLGSERGVLVGVLEEIDDLLQLELGLVGAGDVEEGDAGVGHLLELALGAGEVHGAARAGAGPALRAAEEEEEAREGDEGEEEVAEEGEEAGRAGGVALGDGDVDAVGGEDVDEAGVIGDDDGGAAAVDGGELEEGAVLGEADALDLAAPDGVEEVAVAPLGALGEVGGGGRGVGGGEEGVGQGAVGRGG
jgi:hypothetical protein